MNTKTLGWITVAGGLVIVGVFNFIPSIERPDNATELPLVVEIGTDESRISPVASVPEKPANEASTAGFEEIDGIAVRKDRDCTVRTHYLPNGDGTTTKAYACVPNGSNGRHPYASYSNEALLSLAYSDAKAAEILALRLREIDEDLAMSLAFRASALSDGDATAIQTYSNNYPHAYVIGGVPVEKTLHVKYILSAVSEILGAKVNNYSLWKERVLEHSDNPIETLGQLNEKVDRIVSNMRAIQLEVTGESNIGGNDDV